MVLQNLKLEADSRAVLVTLLGGYLLYDMLELPLTHKRLQKEKDRSRIALPPNLQDASKSNSLSIAHLNLRDHYSCDGTVVLVLSYCQCEPLLPKQVAEIPRSVAEFFR